MSKMMNQSLRDKYMTFLDAQRFPVEHRADMADFVFVNLPAFIIRHFDPSFEGVESRLEPNYFDTIREKVFTNPAAKSENDALDSKYTFALKQWSRFLSTLRNSRKAQPTKIENAKCKMQNSHPDGNSELCIVHSELMTDPLCPDDTESQTEGRLMQVSITRHERNRGLRDVCLRYYAEVLKMPYTCVVCGMNFEKVYGEIGKDYIEVHHLTPISSTSEEHEVDPTKDLVPLCSNCHSMIHRGGKNGMPMPLKNLIAIFERNSQCTIHNSQLEK